MKILATLPAKGRDLRLDLFRGVANWATFLLGGRILDFMPVNLDGLRPCIRLLVVFPPILWLVLRRPNMTLAPSALLYLMARHFGLNVPAYPVGVWYFNPFAWQFL